MLKANIKESEKAMSAQISKHWFTVRDYERMGEAGILPSGERFELIEGEIIRMSPIGKRHVACVNYLTTLLVTQLGQRVIVSVQNPIVLDDLSEPQPDIALLKPRADFYRHSLLAPEDVLLVIEVADTTLDYDRHIKLPLYARAGIAEALIFNLPGEQLEHYAQPANGAYQLTHVFRCGESLSASTVSGAAFDVAAILG